MCQEYPELGVFGVSRILRFSSSNPYPQSLGIRSKARKFSFIGFRSTIWDTKVSLMFSHGP